MWKYLVPFGLFVALGAFLYVGLYRDPRYVPSPLIGKPAPEFSLPSLQDAAYPVSSKELIGQPWVLNVWVPGCGGCRAEHENAARDLAAESRADRRPQLEGRQRGRPAMAEGPRQSLCAVAEDREGRTAIDWGVYGAPETFLIGPDGIVLYKHIAPMTIEDWNKEFLPRIQAARASKGNQS